MFTQSHKLLHITGISLACVSSAALLNQCQTTRDETSGEKDLPNIVFFIADDMYPDMFNCLPEGTGKNLTPNLDRLCNEGVLMTGQHVVSPVCTPSRYNCLTGRYASRAVNEEFLNKTRHEQGQTVVEWNSFITPNDTAFPELLQAAGYKTGFTGKNHVYEVKDLYVFESYDVDPRNPEVKDKLEANANRIKAAIKKGGFDYVANVYHNNPNFLGIAELAVQNMDWIAKGGLDFIDQYHAYPMFLYFATTIPHGPTTAERSWKADPRITAEGYLDDTLKVLPPRESLPGRLDSAGITIPGRENLLWLDDALGALLDRLELYDELDNTIIFFFNDHGQNAKGTIYQGGVHNPSIIWKAGGFDCGNVNDALISNVDFAPTICEMAHAEYDPEYFDGENFKPLLSDNKEKIHKSLYFELGYVRGVRKGDWKYIALRYPEYAQDMSLKRRKEILEDYNEDRHFRHLEIVNRNPDKPFSHLSIIPGGGHAERASYEQYEAYHAKDQLYNLAVDSMEQNNLANHPEYQGKLEEMKKELSKYISDLPGQFGNF